MERILLKMFIDGVKKFLLASILLLFVCFAASGEQIPRNVKTTDFDPGLAAWIERYAVEQMQARHSPGLAVGIVRGDKLVFEGYFGWADIKKRKPVDETTLFRIGSISKNFTAIGLMQQWQMGKFKLDDDINKYLPRPLIFPPHPIEKPVTFRNLFEHTSGGGEILAYRQALMKGYGVEVEGDNYLPLEHYLELGMHTKIDPGELWSYCNYGYAFLGLALEHISGVPFHEYMKKNVLDAVGMTDSTYHHTTEMLQRVATGYQFKHGKYVMDPHKAMGVTPAGNIYTHIIDMSKFVIALLNGGSNSYGSMIKPETLAMMMKTDYTLDDRQEGRGLSFEIFGNDIWGRRIIGHGGSIPFGFTSLMLLVPSEKIGVFVFSNSWTEAPTEITWGILKQVLHAEDKPLPQIKSTEIWPKLEGTYGSKYKYFMNNARLYMAGIGAYKVKVMDGELKLIYLWKGRKKAKTLRQVSADDPYFYRIMESDKIRPHYIAFKTDDSGRAVSIIPGGLDEYIRFGAVRRCKARLVALIGRPAKKILPF